MKKKILLLTSDNVFYLLLKSHIEFLSPYIICEKIAKHSNLNTEIGNKAALIIVDGKIIDISPIGLIYNMRYKDLITTPVWFISEVTTPAYKNKALEVGANKIFGKPFDALQMAREVVMFVL